MHICTHTCFLLDKMHIKPPFKNAKDPTLKKYMNAILQNNYMHMNWCKKKITVTCAWYSCLNCFWITVNMYIVQYDIAIEFTAKEMLICQIFTTIVSEVTVLIKK